MSLMPAYEVNVDEAFECLESKPSMTGFKKRRIDIARIDALLVHLVNMRRHRNTFYPPATGLHQTTDRASFTN
ncbi:hypothetical protein HI914_02339 [Erysiphe necator]|nr:hypothetical protein HI914_02339 [Erysiphe necator]